MKNLIIASLCLSSFLYAAEPTALKYKSINLNQGLSLVDGSRFDIESPAVSNDGTEVCFIGKTRDLKFVYPVQVYTKKIDSSVKSVRVRKKILNSITKCAYDINGDLILSELNYSPFAISASIFHSLRNGDFEPKRYKSVISIYNSDSGKYKKIDQIKAVELDQNHKREFIKHPRVSPNGEWITFYTGGLYGDMGIYLYHIESKKTIHLGTRFEKHPTWNDDGSKILFHLQVADRKVGGVEKAYLGYYDIKFEGTKIKTKRVMLDNPESKGYLYHKHPALYPGTDLLFFHGQEEVDGNKKIYVRRLQEDSRVYRIKMKNANISLRKAKHPTVSRTNSGMIFVGKENQINSKYKVFKLNDSVIQSLIERVK